MVVSFSHVRMYKLLHIERLFAVKHNMYSLENEAIDQCGDLVKYPAFVKQLYVKINK